MNSVGIDTFLKATQAAPKAKPPAPSSEGGEFNDYLREAANTQPAKEQPSAKAKPTDAPVQASSQEQDPANSSDEQANPTVETAEQVDEVVEEQPAGTEADEVLLSGAAIAASSPEVVPAAEAPEVALEVAVETAPVEATQPQPHEGTSATQDFLPNLEDALTAPPAAPIESEVVAPTTNSETVKAAYGDDALLPPAPQAAVPESVPSPVVAQVTAQQQGVDTATDTAEQTPLAPVAQAPAAPQSKPKQTPTDTPAKSDGETDKSDRKTSKATVTDKQAAEQLVATVAATVTEDSAHETKHKATADTGSTAQVTPANSHTQQQPQAADAVQADAQPLNGEQEARMPTIDRTRFVQRVANAFRSAQQNDGQIQMRLSPPELGSLRIEIAVRNGVLSANLETETADVRRVLLDNLPALRQRLAEQDIRIEKFDVDVRREGSQSDGQAGAQDRHAQQQSQRAAAQNRIRTTAPTEVISARVPRPHTTSADTGLDVRI